MLDKKVFLTRVFTAIIFAVIVIFLLNFNKFTVFIFLAIVGFSTAFEYVKIKMDDNAGIRDLVIAPFLFGSAPILIDYFTSSLNFVGFLLLLLGAIIFSIYLLFKLFTNKSSKTKTDFMIYLEVLFYIGIPLLLTENMFLSGDGARAIIIFILILLIWTNDTFAYLSGSMLGKNKLMPSVSPGKTIEGFIGGGVFTLVVSLVLYNYFNMYSIIFYVLMALVVWLIGTSGDLIESKLKRSYSIKDSGKIMPGHGGFLDRFDSFIFVLPYVVLLAYIYTKL